MAVRESREVAPILWLLLFAFVLRVLGQVLVVFFGVTWLPAMEAWMSGLMPYRYLLPAQLMIIAIYGKICVDFTRGTGWFVETRPGFGRGVLVFGYVYFAVMFLRFAAFFSPAASWLGKWIPILFHLVLASFLIVFGRWHRARLAAVKSC